MTAPIVVFVLTYVLIAGRRLTVLPIGRPAGALAGACAMVVLAAIDPSLGLSPREAFAAVEPNTIGLLLGMMLISASVDESGFFERAAAKIARRKMSRLSLLWAISLGSGVLSALLVNDSVCLLLAPLVDRVARRVSRERVPFLLALAMGSNAGSAMTLAGNPQNMLVAQLSGLSYAGYLWRGGVAGLLGLVTTAAVLHLLFRRTLAEARPGQDAPEHDEHDEAAPAPSGEPPQRRWRRRVSLAVVGCVSVAFLLGGNLAWTALAGATAVMLLRRSDAQPLFERVGWTVLVFFAALFVVVAGLQKTGAPTAALQALGPHLPRGHLSGALALTGTLVVGCQLVSNVPFILLAEPWIRSLPDPVLAWTSTAVVTTLAGNLTLLGSVANIIVIETAHAQGEIGFRRYMRVGIPVTLASTAVAVAWLLLVH